MVKLGFIGLGHITTHAHLPALKPLVDAGEVELSAFCDLSEEMGRAQAEIYAAKAVYTNHHEMFAKEELDAVYICIPPTAHNDEISCAIERGIAVFVEKPQSLDMSQAAGFARAIEAAGVVSQVGFMSRYYESAEFTRQLLQQRTPRHAQIQMFYSGRHIRYWTSRYELCGGSFVENTVHMVDLLGYLLGDYAKVSAFYFERRPGEGPEPINMPYVYSANYRFESGVLANATTSRVLTEVKASRRELLIVCDDSLIEWSAQAVVENGETLWQAGESNNAFVTQAAAFVEAVRAGDLQRMRSPYPASLNSLAAVLGANASAENGGQVVDLASFVAGE